MATILTFLRAALSRAGATWCRRLLVAAVCTSAPASAAEPPSPGGNDSAALDREVRTALAGAVEFFRKRAAEDAEGWVVPPARTRKVVDREIITHQYREVTREIPVYKYEYGTYEVVEKVRVGQSSDAVDTFRKVQRKRVVSRKQVGTRTVKRLVLDPDGPIARDHVRPIYGPGGPDNWARDALGDNALALFALRRAGVPADDATVEQLATRLTIFLSNYGYPDATWDLAWLTAAFAAMPGEAHQETARLLASKLLDGQIRDGAAAGLWGPVAINTALLAERMLVLEKHSRKLTEAKQVAGAGRTEERAYERAKTAYQEELSNLLRVATFGMAGHLIERAVTISPGEADTIVMAGLTDYIYNQRTADLGSTALALYALRQAAEYGAFPGELWRPEGSKVRPESPSALLGASVRALADELVEKRGWDEMNHYQPVKDFDEIRTFPGLPRAEVDFPEPASGTSLLTTMQGFSAMSDAVRIAKTGGLDAKYRRHLEKGSELFRAAAEDLLEGWPAGESKPQLFAPYDHCLFLSEVTREPGSSKEDRRDLWEPLARGLLSLRFTDGSWRHMGPGRRFHLPTSLFARIAVMEAPGKGALVEYDKPQVDHYHRAIATALQSGRRLRTRAEHVVPTAFAMVFLAENVRPPVIGECLWSPDAGPSRLIPVVTRVMRQQKGLPLRYSAVERPVGGGSLGELPALLVRGAGAFDPGDDEKAALEAHLGQGGLVIVEATADSGGADFLSGAERELAALLPESSPAEDVGSDQDLMGAAAGTARVRALRQPDGSLSVVFLPLAPDGEGEGLPRSTAARAIYNMLFQKIDPGILEEGYPISVDAGPEPGAGAE